jgi:hypothetical protein
VVQPSTPPPAPQVTTQEEEPQITPEEDEEVGTTTAVNEEVKEPVPQKERRSFWSWLKGLFSF